MMRKYIIVLVVLFLVSGCASTNSMIDEMAELNSRPFIADTLEPQEHITLELPPLSVSDNEYDSLIAMDKERRSYRKMLVLSDQESYANVMVTNSLLKALKASEMEQRATERMAIRYKYELESEKKSAFWNDLGHRLAEVLLFGMFIIK